MAKFDFFPLETKKQPFVPEMSKIQGGLGRPSDAHAHIYVMFVNFWELIIAFPNGGQWAPFSKV